MHITFYHIKYHFLPYRVQPFTPFYYIEYHILPHLPQIAIIMFIMTYFDTKLSTYVIFQ